MSARRLEIYNQTITDILTLEMILIKKEVVTFRHNLDRTLFEYSVTFVSSQNMMFSGGLTMLTAKLKRFFTFTNKICGFFLNSTQLVKSTYAL